MPHATIEIPYQLAQTHVTKLELLLQLLNHFFSTELTTALTIKGLTFNNYPQIINPLK